MRIGVLQLDDVRLGFEYKEGAGVFLSLCSALSFGRSGSRGETRTWELIWRSLTFGLVSVSYVAISCGFEMLRDYPTQRTPKWPAPLYVRRNSKTLTPIPK